MHAHARAHAHAHTPDHLQEMDTRVEYDKAKAVKWLMAPGLIEISAEDIAAAHEERKAREIARWAVLGA